MASAASRISSASPSTSPRHSLLVRVRAIARVRVRAIARVRVRVGARGPPVDESEVARQLAVESVVEQHELDLLVRVRGKG